MQLASATACVQNRFKEFAEIILDFKMHYTVSLNTVRLKSEIKINQFLRLIVLLPTVSNGVGPSIVYSLNFRHLSIVNKKL